MSNWGKLWCTQFGQVVFCFLYSVLLFVRKRGLVCGIHLNIALLDRFRHNDAAFSRGQQRNAFLRDVKKSSRAGPSLARAVIDGVADGLRREGGHKNAVLHARRRLQTQQPGRLLQAEPHPLHDAAERARPRELHLHARVWRPRREDMLQRRSRPVRLPVQGQQEGTIVFH